MSRTNYMRKRKELISNMYKFNLIGFLVIITLLLTNFTQESIIFIIVRNILAITFILFLSGYTLVSILFKKEKLEFSEFLTHCVGLSICISILCAMLVHFSGLKINFVNIVNLITMTTMILAFLNFLDIFVLKGIGGKK